MFTRINPHYGEKYRQAVQREGADIMGKGNGANKEHAQQSNHNIGGVLVLHDAVFHIDLPRPQHAERQRDNADIDILQPVYGIQHQHYRA